jgi:hypothetical protein
MYDFERKWLSVSPALLKIFDQQNSVVVSYDDVNTERDHITVSVGGTNRWKWAENSNAKRGKD